MFRAVLRILDPEKSIPDLESGKTLFRIPDPGSKRHRIPDPDQQHRFRIWFHMDGSSFNSPLDPDPRSTRFGRSSFRFRTNGSQKGLKKIFTEDRIPVVF